MNYHREDLGRFRIFLSVSNNFNTRYSHRHSDAFSYVVFVDGSPFLIDPGRPNYKETKWLHSRFHNGLSSLEGMVPEYRFWKGNITRRAFEFKLERGNSSLTLSVINKINKDKKKITIRYKAINDGHETLELEEAYFSKRKKSGTFSLLWFENSKVKLSANLLGTKLPISEVCNERNYSIEYGVERKAKGFCVEFSHNRISESKLKIELKD